LTYSHIRTNVLVVELRGRYWNGRYGRMARRDLWLKTDGKTWHVEARQGDGDADVWSSGPLREYEARKLIDDMRERTGGGWKDITSLLAPRPVAKP
jgi:hypothetical protein